MKIYSIFLLYKPKHANRSPVIIGNGINHSAFGYFTRTTAQETMVFASRTLVERTMRGKRELLHHINKDCHALVLPDGLSCVVITDEEYPPQAALGLSHKLLNQFKVKHQDREWEKEEKDLTLETEWLEKMVVDCQDPKKADVVYRIMSDLQDTQDIMRKNIEDLLARGEKLDTLLQKTNDLGIKSKQLMKDAEKLNKCCYFF